MSIDEPNDREMIEQEYFLLEQHKGNLDAKCEGGNSMQELQKKDQEEREKEKDCRLLISVRICFCLPNGFRQTQFFCADSPLSELYAFVRNDLNIKEEFSLSTTFPYRNLDSQDKETSLKDLQMVPMATVKVFPIYEISAYNGSLSSVTSTTSLYPKGYTVCHKNADFSNDFFFFIGFFFIFSYLYFNYLRPYVYGSMDPLDEQLYDYLIV